MNKNIKKKEIIEAIVKKEIYSKKQFKILALDNDIVVKVFNTSMHSNLKGIKLRLIGNIVKTKYQGKEQIKMDFPDFEILDPDILFFLMKYVKGIQRDGIRQFLENNNENLLIEYLDEKNEKELLKIKGIGKKVLIGVLDSWKETREEFLFLSYFSKLGMSHSLIKKIMDFYLTDLQIGRDYFLKKYKENPYMIIEIEGVGFKMADRAAVASGIDLTDPLRINACISFVFKEIAEREGSTVIPSNGFYRHVIDFLSDKDEGNGSILKLGITEDHIQKIIDNLIDKNEIIVIEENFYSHSHYYNLEKNILLNIEKRLKNKHKLIQDIDIWIKNQEKKIGITYSDLQKKSIKIANEMPGIMMLSGYAGTGKSTTSKTILDLFFTNSGISYDDIAVMAISGIATDKVKRSTGYNGNTIAHFLSGMNYSNTSVLDKKIILIDESSMINSVTFYDLFSKISNDSHIILVGDPAQLPPIGSGNVFSDLLKHSIPQVELTEIYRTKDGNIINEYAYDIRNGNVPKNFEKENKNFKFIDKPFKDKNYWNIYKQVKEGLLNKQVGLDNELSAEEYLRDVFIEEYLKNKKTIYENFSNKKYYEFLYDYQIIAPIKNTTQVGTIELNKIIQEKMNNLIPKVGDENVSIANKYFKYGDKVINISNTNMQYVEVENLNCSSYIHLDNVISVFNDKKRDKKEIKIYNGYVGILIYLDNNKEDYYIYYPLEKIVVKYNLNELEELVELAYAITVHKSQGSEYKNVYFPINFKYYYKMMNNKMMYTAITRSSEHITLIGDTYTFTNSIKRKDLTERNTVLMYLI